MEDKIWYRGSMAKEKTLVIIKPDAIKRKLVGEIISRIERNERDWSIVDIKMGRLTKKTAKILQSRL